MTNIQKQYPFSSGTIEGEALKKLNSEERVATLQNTEVWDEANKINDKVDLMLGFKQEENTQIIEKIEDKNHPKALGLKQWLNQNPENQKWYDENLGNNFNLVDDGIMILGDIFELNDEESTENVEEGIYKNEQGATLFNFDAAKKHTKSKGKKMISDWSKYINFLPGDYDDKLDFLKNVLGLTFAGYRFWRNGNMKFEDVAGFYWSEKSDTDIADYLELDAYNFNIFTNTPKTFAFILRCIKN